MNFLYKTFRPFATFHCGFFRKVQYLLGGLRGRPTKHRSSLCRSASSPGDLFRMKRDATERASGRETEEFSRFKLTNWGKRRLKARKSEADVKFLHQNLVPENKLFRVWIKRIKIHKNVRTRKTRKNSSSTTIDRVTTREVCVVWAKYLNGSKSVAKTYLSKYKWINKHARTCIHFLGTYK